jgi:hypothetical protein
VYDSASRSIYHRERVRLSEDVLTGREPTDDEKRRWTNRLLLFTDD